MKRRAERPPAKKVPALDGRSRQVLEALIQHHVLTAQPVGSETIARNFGIGTSSATIRNVMADLEEQGYLTHRHTSAGRLPTDRGYRVYVDTLKDVQRLSEQERERIEREYNAKRAELDDVLKGTSQLLAMLSNVAGVALRPTPAHAAPQRTELVVEGSSNVLNQPEFSDLGKVQALFRLIDEKRELSRAMAETIEEGAHVKVSIGAENRLPAIRECSLVTKTYAAGGRSVGVIGILGPMRMDYDKMVALVDHMAGVVSRSLREGTDRPA